MLTSLYRLLFLVSIFSFSVYANELWTRYQFVNLEIPSPSHVNTLHEDSLGQVWVGADSGLYRIHNNKIQKVSHAPKFAIEHIVRAESDGVLLATSGGVWRWQSQTNHFSAFSCPDEQNFYRLIKHPSMGLIALSRSGVYQLAENKACHKISFGGLPANARVERLVIFKQNLVLAVYGHGLFQCLKQCTNIEPFAPELKNTRVRELKVNENTLYAGTHKHGFYAINILGEVERHWHRNAKTQPDDFSLPVNGVMTLLPTAQSIWAGLWAGGLQQFDAESGRKISSSRFYAPDISTIGGRHVRALLASQNNTLYIGHENGISIILPAYNQQDWIGLANDFQQGFSHDNVVSLSYHRNNLFAGSSSGGLYRIGSADNNILRMSADSPSPFNLPTKSIWDIKRSQQGDLLLGTANGVIRLNPDNLNWQLFGDSSLLKSSDVFSLTEAPDQTLWLSLWEGGVARLDKNGQLIGQWSQEHGLQQNTAIAITSTKDNQIFVLNSTGLFRYESEQNRFANAGLQISQNHCETIDHINTDVMGQLWALCDHNSLWRLQQDTWEKVELPISEPVLHMFAPFKGAHQESVNLFLLSASQVFAFDQQGKLLWQKLRMPLSETININQSAVVNNSLVFSTDQGIYRQHLDQSYDEPQALSPIISGVRLFNKPWQTPEHNRELIQLSEGSALFNGQLQLDYDQDLITFEFAVPGYHHQASQEFNYRLAPFDRGWLTTAEDEAKASYTRLPPGKYQFEVKASNLAGGSLATFQLEILPPWYLTWWAKTLALITIVASVLMVIIGRTRRLEKRNLWLQERVEERTVELKLANEKLKQAANLDALTGLLNRRGFRNLCDPNWEQWQGDVLLMIADIDLFKRINDQYGHQLGDEVLVTCAQRLLSQAGEHDLIARWGGEEFLILLRDEPKSSQENLLLRAQKLQQVIGQESMELSSQSLKVTLTAGVCEHQGQRFETCLQQADQKLYDGKNEGRNRLVS